MPSAEASEIPGTALSLNDLKANLRGDVRGLLLYGSRARGTDRPGSDVDVLQLSNVSGPTVHIGLVSVSRYDAQSLRSLLQRGSIFGRHLHNEAKVLWDPVGELRGLLSEFRAPISYARTLSLIRLIAEALSLPHDSRYDIGVHRAAVYCARTALYISSIQAGNEHFDSSRIAGELGFDKFDEAKQLQSASTTSYLLDVALTLSAGESSPAFTLAPDFESAITQLALRFPDAAQFLSSLLSVRHDLPYSTLSLPFA